MDIFALDSDFNLAAPNLPYINLQWTRRYFEPGEFEVEIRSENYDPLWSYFASTVRPELAIIQGVQKNPDRHSVLLSGFFYEKILDDKVCFPRYKSRGITDAVCTAIFNQFKDTLPIRARTPAGIGDATTCDFSDDPLGRKLYSILETRQMSFSIGYDHDANDREFYIWRGVDRTQGNTENNPFYVFSTSFGNLENIQYKYDDSGYKNYVIIPAAKDENDVETITVIVDETNGFDKKEMVLDRRTSRPDQGESLSSFEESLKQDGREALLEKSAIESLSVDNYETGGYMVKYDLGDKCDVVVPELGLAKQLRIIEVREVFKASKHTISLEFGNNRKGGL